jgi:hypothetical protein
MTIYRYVVLLLWNLVGCLRLIRTCGSKICLQQTFEYPDTTPPLTHLRECEDSAHLLRVRIYPQPRLRTAYSPKRNRHLVRIVLAEEYMAAANLLYIRFRCYLSGGQGCTFRYLIIKYGFFENKTPIEANLRQQSLIITQSLINYNNKSPAP